LLVVAGGDVVVDRGFGGGRNDRLWNLKSASKSLLSALVGIAVEEGKLPGLDAPLSELLPGELPEGADGKARGRITLRHLLTQTTGLESTSGPAYGAWVSSDDWTRAALARPLLTPPGEEFRYSTGNTHLVSAVLTEATGTSTLAYARSRLLDPLGIGEITWERSPEGVYLGGNQLSMTAKDFARFGLLYLHGGKWNGQQLVPTTWVTESTEKHVETGPDWQDRYGDYGYLWWVPRGHDGAYLAVGYGGQYLYVAPQTDLIVVMTATLEGKGAEWDRRALELIQRMGQPPASN
jgi:CubicO group peptidase (beta-lactamase class C family)